MVSLGIEIPPSIAACLSREKAYLTAISVLKREIFSVQQSISSQNKLHDSANDKLRTIYVDPTVQLEIIDLRLKLVERDQEIKRLMDQLNEGTLARESGEGLLGKLRDKLRKLTEENKQLATLLAEDRLQPLQIKTSGQQKQLEFCRDQLRNLWELLEELWDDERIQQVCKQLAEVTRENSLLKQSLEAEFTDKCPL